MYSKIVCTIGLKDDELLIFFDGVFALITLSV